MELQQAVELSKRVQNEIKKSVKGKDDCIRKAFCAILAGGHILIEDVPGVGKTTLALAFSRALCLENHRVQFTPDVLPADILGFSIYDKEQGGFYYHPGAVMCNLFLADEINRTSPKTQSALLEAMEEGSVTVDGVTYPLPNPFICIATQNPELRKRFKGKPEYVVNFMHFVAQELREYMAKLGVRTVDELVGRTDLLKKKEHIPSERANKVDLSNILGNPYEGMHFRGYRDKLEYDFKLDQTIDEQVFLKQLKTALNKGQKKSLKVDVSNVDRTLGTIFGSEITRQYPDGLPEDTFTIQCNGSGGQSFGAFIPKGLTLELCGDSNDYFGKGLSGGKLIVYPPKNVKFKAEDNIVIGNVALYGATSGKAYINGVAGERFCVRNSGATAVVEGVGDHGCEYMTGGRVVVLGTTGKNFAAGMSGGIAYVLDEKRDLYKRLNKELVSLEEVTNKYDVQELKEMIQDHVAYTGSARGKEILDHFGEYLPKFKKVMPHDYRRMMNTIVQMEEKGLSSEQAQIEAFYANQRK